MNHKHLRKNINNLKLKQRCIVRDSPKSVIFFSAHLFGSFFGMLFIRCEKQQNNGGTGFTHKTLQQQHSSKQLNELHFLARDKERNDRKIRRNRLNRIRQNDRSMYLHCCIGFFRTFHRHTYKQTQMPHINIRDMHHMY